jgi:hypothetical protein
MMALIAVLYALFFLYVALYGYYNGVVRRDIPGNYAARRLKGDEARRHGWLMVVIGLLNFVMLIVTVIIVHVRTRGR